MLPLLLIEVLNLGCGMGNPSLASAAAGVAAIIALIEGTTFLGMFTPEDYCLFAEHELEKTFAG